MKDKKEKTGSFESLLAEIEAIVNSIETGELEIEEAVKQYEKGMALVAKCRHMLKDSKLKIEALKKKSKKGWETEPLDEEEDKDDDKESGKGSKGELPF